MLKGKKSNLSSHDQCETYSFSDMVVTNGQFSREKVSLSTACQRNSIEKICAGVEIPNFSFKSAKNKVLEAVGNPVRLCALK